MTGVQTCALPISHLEDKAELPHDTCESEVVTPRSDTSEADNSPPLENQEATADEIKDEATSDVVNNLETQEIGRASCRERV